MQDIRDLLEGLRRTPKILSQFVQTIQKEKLDVRRGLGAWTIAEHVIHLAEVQPMLYTRFQRFINEERPEFVPYIPDADENQDSPPRIDVTEALERFARFRGEQLLLLEKADDATWAKTAIHPEYESYSFYILVRHALMHDFWHMYRIEELWLTKDAYLTQMG